ncbi:hypothetical protein [Blastomonas aquatica]|uniref:Uncharacterized protein n=1 Tax=Blastomonas aquatica TaxID=1510276 RepID=A0ABQ1IZL3_9SPHN|nr:hypothetical protein [Blastomonas aquatica]GGB55200.1 hypothetical protein GCM10010833_07370 [Blastomonas aquatica]
MFKASVVLLSGLLLWAAWFVIAYALHGAQCAGGFALYRTSGQIAQIGLWVVSLGVIVLQARFVQRWGVRHDLAPRLMRSARYLQITAIAATVFVGLPVLVLAPC